MIAVFVRETNPHRLVRGHVSGVKARSKTRHHLGSKRIDENCHKQPINAVAWKHARRQHQVQADQQNPVVNLLDGGLPVIDIAAATVRV